MVDKCHEVFYMDPPKEEDLRRFREQQKKGQKLTKEYILHHLGIALVDIRQREGEFSYCGDVIEDTIRYLEEEEK